MPSRIVKFSRISSDAVTDDFSSGSLAGWSLSKGQGQGDIYPVIDNANFHQAASGVKEHIQGTAEYNCYSDMAKQFVAKSTVAYALGWTIGQAPGSSPHARKILIGGSEVVGDNSNFTVWTREVGARNDLIIGNSYWADFELQYDTTPNHTIYWDEVAFGPGQVTVRGLLPGQKVRYYGYDGAYVGDSIAASGGLLIDPLTATECLQMPFSRLEITDTDGHTVIGQYVPGNAFMDQIFGGDVYEAIITKTKNRNPPYSLPLTTEVCEVVALTTKKTFRDFLPQSRVEPSSQGELGAFELWVPDETGHDADLIPEGSLIWIYGCLGLQFRRILAGQIDRVEPHTLPGDMRVLALAGMSRGEWLDMHGYANTTTYFGKNAYYILTNPTDGIASFTPELDFAGVRVPETILSYVTYLPGRTGWDVANEAADMSSTLRKDWQTFDCPGEHLGERGPTVHFEPTMGQISQLPVVSDRTFKDLATTDLRQVKTMTISHYAYSYYYDDRDLVRAYSALTQRVKVNGTVGDAYIYTDLTTVADYVVRAGDYLEYDVYWTSKDQRSIFDIVLSTGTALRNVTPTLRDGRGMTISSTTDISRLAVNQWYSRKIRLPSSWVDATIQKYIFIEDSDKMGTYVAGFRNVRITDGKDTTRKSIWEGDYVFTAATDSSSGVSQVTRQVGSSTLTEPYLAGGDPKYRICPYYWDKPWMTLTQAQNFVKRAALKLGAAQKFLQLWMPIDCQRQSGQLIPLIDDSLWAKGMLMRIAYRLDSHDMELTLQI